VVITEAEQSPRDQLRSRQIKYVAMMGVRTVCLIVAAVLVGLKVPHAMFWVAICIAGMVALPWMAVIIANDRPPKKSSRFTSRFRPRPDEPRALPPVPDDRIVDQ
jgi:arginine exporter protein ArgO